MGHFYLNLCLDQVSVWHRMVATFRDGREGGAQNLLNGIQVLHMNITCSGTDCRI